MASRRFSGMAGEVNLGGFLNSDELSSNPLFEVGSEELGVVHEPRHVDCQTEDTLQSNPNTCLGVAGDDTLRGVHLRRFWR